MKVSTNKGVISAYYHLKKIINLFISVTIPMGVLVLIVFYSLTSLVALIAVRNNRKVNLFFILFFVLLLFTSILGVITKSMSLNLIP